MIIRCVGKSFSGMEYTEIIEELEIASFKLNGESVVLRSEMNSIQCFRLRLGEARQPRWTG